MRRLYINNVLLELDDNTAIGIDLQSYDFKNPALRKVKVSNSFNIPATIENLKEVGFVGGTQTTDKKMYNALYCDYYIGNVQFIEKAKVRIEAIESRIEIFVFEKPDIWDTLKGVKWGEFTQSYFSWLNIPKAAVDGVPSLQTYVNEYAVAGGSNAVFLPYCACSGGDIDDDLYLANFDTIDSQFDQSGGNFFSFIIDVFKYIEETYSVNFYTTGTTFDFNIWDDAIAPNMYWHFRDLFLKKDAIAPTENYYFDLVTGQESDYLLGFTASETRDKSLYDFVISFIQQFNIIIDSNNDNYKLRRFDDIENAPVQNFSGGLTGRPRFLPYIPAYNQNSYIRYQNVEDGISENSGARILTCLNKNIDEENELFKINAFYPTFTNNKTNNSGGIDQYVPDLKTKDSFKNFKFFTNGAQLTTDVEVYVKYTIDGAVGGVLAKADYTGFFAPVLYSLNSEYQILDSALDYPVFFEVKKWLTPLEVLNFEFFKLYWIRELNGAYFINKIKGFNPAKSKQATTLELFKISDKTPGGIPVVLENWTDGLGVDWTDGLGVIWQTNI